MKFTKFQWIVLAILGVMAIAVIGLGILIIRRLGEPTTPQVSEEPSFAQSARTPILLPPTWTPLAVNSSATATSVQRSPPQLVSGEPRDYIPSQSEMPEGFELAPSYSGPVPVDRGRGHRITFENEGNKLVTERTWAVEFSFYIYETEELAADSFTRLSSNPKVSGPGWEVELLEAPRMKTNEADDFIMFAGVTDVTSPPSLVSISYFRLKNVSLTMFTSSFASHDLERSVERLGTEVLYYLSLVTGKIKE